MKFPLPSARSPGPALVQHIPGWLRWMQPQPGGNPGIATDVFMRKIGMLPDLVNIQKTMENQHV
jgi:hypothetical protein